MINICCQEVDIFHKWVAKQTFETCKAILEVKYTESDSGSQRFTARRPNYTIKNEISKISSNNKTIALAE